MTAVVCVQKPSLRPTGFPAQSEIAPPINFFYAHLHNSIRAELNSLSECVLLLEPALENELPARLLQLKERYHFLEQVYKYHSSVEDEVVYPALDAKVKNVTLAYSVEHQDEELLFEQLSQLLNAARAQSGKQRTATVRQLVCKVEEIHTTLRKHLAKEEEQLLPLLLKHFSYAEQAELVAQFLYCIPLATVERVLSWLKPMVPQEEQEQLLTQLRTVVPDHLLLQLLVTWLQPAGQRQLPEELLKAANDCTVPLCAAAPAAGTTKAAAVAGQPASGATAGPGAAAPDAADGSCGWQPLQGIVLFHHSIQSAMKSFVCEARLLEQSSEASSSQLAALLDRHRFLRSVCMFHTLSEEEVLFPEVQKLAGFGLGGPAAAAAACHACSLEHEHEITYFDELGRLLADVRGLARRGRKEVSAMLGQLCSTAERVCGDITVHMQREELEVLPLLQQHLGAAEQRAVVWHTLRAMPLRLLQRVMPWLVAELTEEEAEGLMQSIKLGAPEIDATLVQLLSRWASSARLEQRAGGRPAGWAGATAALDPNNRLQPSPTSSDSSAVSSPDDEHGELPSGAAAEPPQKRMRLERASSYGGHSSDDQTQPSHHHPRADPHLHYHHEQRHDRSQQQRQQQQQQKCQLAASGSGPLTSSASPRSARQSADNAAATLPSVSTGATGGAAAAIPADRALNAADAAAPGPNPFNPIDHIFQFHNALREELRQLEADAVSLETAVLSVPLAGTTSHQEEEEAAGSAAVTAQHPPAPAPDDSSTGDAADAAAGDPLVVFRRTCAAPLQQLDGRFRFLWGIYRAHSKAEDEIVFPALESKEALHNVSHAYTLDHQQEEQLFVDLEQVIRRVQHSEDLVELRELSLALRRMCAAVRASLETHVRAEESELWPLFAEHFTIREQQYLVGVIIGRTGAEVLMAMLPWVAGAATDEERDAMLKSLREAAKNTMFDQWLGAVEGQHAGPSGSGSPTGTATATAAAAAANRAAAAQRSGSGGDVDMHQPLADVALYLSGNKGLPEMSGTVTDSTAFRPGWEDIFRMNQQQLEAAVRRVSSDPTLEPDRKAYLIQNIMVSRYIVAQQKRLQENNTCQHDQAAQQQPPPPPQQLQSAAATAVAAAAGGAGCSQCNHTHGRDERSDTERAAAAAAAAAVAGGSSSSSTGCAHYKRRCQLVAPCCGRAYTCRICHDDDADHRMDRYAVSEMLCTGCSSRQPVAQHCRTCGLRQAAYYCSICHLFDDEPGREIYHCPFCNVCRRGRGLGLDFFHCMNCNACMSLSLFSSHRCRERATEAACPVCHEDLFDSSAPIKELPCGHFMHSGCFATYTRYSYTCPVCCKSIGDMSVYFQMLDSLLGAERAKLPPEYATRRQRILCHDCGRTGDAAFHFVYHACSGCRSYNTRLL